MSSQQEHNQLQRSMKSRHLFMISLGGVIGTGFFLGSGYTISQAGPFGAILSYLVGGLIMYLTMLCLGELSVAMPVAGSFQTYTTRFIGPATGFAVGWLYWLGWAVTVALELLSAASLMQRWYADVPAWVWCLVFGIVLFLLNALSAKITGGVSPPIPPWRWTDRRLEVPHPLVSGSAHRGDGAEHRRAHLLGI